MKKKMVIAVGIILLMVFTGSVWADSITTDGADAAVNLDFSITIPGYIYFRVGDSGAIGQVVFTPSQAQVANGTANIAASSGGSVVVRLRSNLGQITITPTNDGSGNGLSSTSHTDRISYAQITTRSTGTDTINPPGLTDAGGTPSIIAPNVDNVINLDGEWTYEYSNPLTPPEPGIYTGRVTYTASNP